MAGPVVVFFGNCQLDALCKAYTVFAVPHLGGQATYMRHGARLAAAEQAVLQQADVVVQQHLPMHGVVAPDGVPPGARRLTVPLVDGSFLWPFSGTAHPDSIRRYGAYNPFVAEMSDSWLLRRLAAGSSGGEAVRDYMSTDMAVAGRLSRRREMALEAQAAREAGTPYRFASLIETHLATECLFYSPYHLTGRLARHMLLTLLGELQAPAPAVHAAATYMTRNFVTSMELPVHPATAQHFGLQWCNAATRFAFWREDVLTFAQWCGRLVRCEAYPALQAAVDAVADNKPEAAAMLAAALLLVPYSPWGQHAAAVLLLRAGEAAQALPLLEAAMARHPAILGASITLYECLKALNRNQEAAAALEQAVLREPFKVPQHIRLAAQYLAENDRRRAVPHVQAILALNPRNPWELRHAAKLGLAEV